MYLSLLGWSFSAEGVLHLDGSLSVSVTTDSLHDIRSALRQSWAYYIQRQISQRKGTVDHPFDFTVLHKATQSMSVSELKQIAYDLTGGYQVAAVKSTWSSVVDANCLFCNQLDTHRHRWTAPRSTMFGNDTHRQSPQQFPDKLWLPLPWSFPEVITLRQLLAFRGQPTKHSPIQMDPDVLYFDTDGSADNP